MTFHTGPYDPTAPLVIDPALSYSTYLGGSFPDSGNGIAIDAAGSAFVVGSTQSLDFPITNAIQASNATADAFIAKLNAAGAAPVYSTYLGGRGSDSAKGIAVDAAGYAYATGSTSSTDFPTANAAQATFGGTGPLLEGDAFVAKLSPTGSALVYSTYLGGSGDDSGNAIAVDVSGNAYVTGDTTSTAFPTTSGAFDRSCGTDGACNPVPVPFVILRSDAFVTKLNATGALAYSTYLGAAADDLGNAIALDPSGAAYVTGYTDSAGFPTAGAFQPVQKGAREAFVTKINPAGSGLVYSTYIGGSRPDEGKSIAVDSAARTFCCTTRR